MTEPVPLRWPAAYIRVSSAGQSSSSQREAVSRAASARGDEIPKWAWFEEQKSATRLDRPVLTELRAAAREGKIRRLYLFRLDRLTRTGIRDTLSLLAEFEHHGCEVVTLADGFSLAGPARDVVVAVLAWAAQMEREALGERISAARSRVEASGKTWGRPKREDHAAKIARVVELYDRKGWSLREIAIGLKIPKPTVARWLKSYRKGAPAAGLAGGEKIGVKKAQP